MDIQEYRNYLINLLSKSKEGSIFESFIIDKLHTLDSKANAPKLYKDERGAMAEVGRPYKPERWRGVDTNITPLFKPQPTVNMPAYIPNPMKTYDEGIYQNPYQKQPVNTIRDYQYGREPDMEDIRGGKLPMLKTRGIGGI